MANQKMGFEGKIYYGTAGSTASNELTNSRDINYNLDKEDGDTTVRGAGTTPPVNTSQVTARVASIEFTMINDATDTYLEAMRVAAYAGTPVAIRTKDYASGKGFDGDCTLSMQHGKPLRGEQTYQFTATPTLAGGRTPSLYV